MSISQQLNIIFHMINKKTKPANTYSISLYDYDGCNYCLRVKLIAFNQVYSRN